MRIVALLSWYDEDPAWLARALRSARDTLAVDAIVALDGRYEHYRGPGGPRSPDDQYDAIRHTADGLPLEIDGRDSVWPTQIAKRAALFTLGESLTGPDDWYLVLDADSEMVGAPTAIRRALEETRLDVATVTLIEPGKPDRPFRALFRAVRGLAPVGNHYTYTTPDGRHLWGHITEQPVEPARDLSGLLTMRHHTAARSAERHAAQTAYYGERNRIGLERGPCRRCGEPSVCMMLDDFTPDGPGRVSGGYVEVCAACLPWYAERNAALALKLGVPVRWAVRARNRVADLRERVEAARAATV